MPGGREGIGAAGRSRLARRAVGFTPAWLVALSLIGCTAPPSVAPLLRAARHALGEEAGRLEADQKRQQQWMDRTRDSLKAAYEADLAGRETLTRPWVREATAGYVAAREAVVRHRMNLKRRSRKRAEDLRATAAAVRRAEALLEQQDALITRTTGIDGWDLLRAGE